MPAETTPSTGDSLKGKVLIAMPDMADPRFHQSVIVMLEHNSEGAMGVMINKKLDAVSFNDLLEQLEISHLSAVTAEPPVYFGGPVELGRGFVLHSTDMMLAHSMVLPPVAVTTSLEMLEKIATSTGPQHNLFCLGYTGWSAGQLDEEIRQNAWLHAPLDADLLFSIPVDDRWKSAMRIAGVDLDHLSSTAGSA